MGISLSVSNSKLVKTSGESYKVVGFGLPADHDFVGPNGEAMNTCFGAGACRGPCFAKQGRYIMESVMNPRLSNLQATMQDSFVPDMIAALRRKRSYNTVRIHDSGDFYSQSYLDKWIAIAKALPGKVFYAYTKALTLDFTQVPGNLRITQSLGGKFDRLVNRERPHSRIFRDVAAREAAGYVDGNTDDIPAIEGEIRIGLVYHGVKNLTPAQKAYFV
jgi:hypothetical protein